jgi:septum site-determining protein MinC
VVVDLRAFPPDSEGVADFLLLLERKGIHIIGTEGAHPSWDGVGRWGRPMAASSKPARPIEIPAEAPGTAQPAAAPTPEPSATEPTTLVIEHAVRSGQSIVFERGDVTILGSVASGAEVMAGGSVHIYGALRGRAIAGLAGNAKARIFCRKLQAELVAIDGVYQTADDMPAAVIGKAAQAWLDGERMRITTLD